jgi:hypothetical protein
MFPTRFSDPPGKDTMTQEFFGDGTMSQKLYIYDQTSSLDREQASGRFSASENVYALPVDSVEDLQGRLDYSTAMMERLAELLEQLRRSAAPLIRKLRPQHR